MIYKLIRNNLTGEVDSVIGFKSETEYVSFVFDPANTDYQQYLKWLEEGGVPEPADEVAE